MIERYRARPVEDVFVVVFDGTPESLREIQEWSGIDLSLRIETGEFRQGDAVALKNGGGFSVMTGGWLDSHYEKVVERGGPVKSIEVTIQPQSADEFAAGYAAGLADGKRRR